MIIATDRYMVRAKSSNEVYWEQDVYPAAGTQVEDNLAGLQFCQGSGVTAPQRGQQRFLGDLACLAAIVEV